MARTASRDAKRPAKSKAPPKPPKTPKKRAPASGGDLPFVARALRLEGDAAAVVREELDDLRGTAAGLRSRVIAALVERGLVSGSAPAWLLVQTGDLEDVVHLDAPMFRAKAADGDEFWSECETEQLIYQGAGKALRRGPENEEGEQESVSDADAASLDAYQTGGEVVLHDLSFKEPPPKTIAAFEKLLGSADDAFHGEMEAYDAGDFAPAETSSAPATTASVAPSNATHFLGGPGRTGTFDGAAPREKPKVLWADVGRNSGGGEWGGNVIAGEGIAVGATSSFNCWVTALDPKSGKTLWSKKTSESQSWPAGEPCIADGVAYLPTNHGLHAFDAKTGKDRWLARLSGAQRAPLVWADTIVVGAKKGLYAISLANGRKKWTFAAKTAAYGHVASDARSLFFHADGKLVCLDPANPKKPRWAIPSCDSTFLRGGPLVSGDRVFFFHDALEIAAADCGTGKLVWRAKREELIWQHGFALSGDTLVLKDGTGALVAFDAENGKVRWTAGLEKGKTYGIGHGGPVIANGAVFCVLTEESEDDYDNPRFLHAFDLKSGKQLWKLPQWRIKGQDSDTEWSWHATPFVADGVLYAQADSGIVALVAG